VHSYRCPVLAVLFMSDCVHSACRIPRAPTVHGVHAAPSDKDDSDDREYGEQGERGARIHDGRQRTGCQ
jgi:hypothetical protein